MNMLEYAEAFIVLEVYASQNLCLAWNRFNWIRKNIVILILVWSLQIHRLKKQLIKIVFHYENVIVATENIIMQYSTTI